MNKQLFFIAILIAFVTPTIGQPVVGAAYMDSYLPLLEGKKVAVCANPTSVVEGTHLVEVLIYCRIAE